MCHTKTNLLDLHSFNTACYAYKQEPTLQNLLHVNTTALALLPSQKPAYNAPLPSRDWIPIECPYAFRSEWDEIRCIVSKHLNDEEVLRVAGAIGYALRETLAGDDLLEPFVIRSIRAGQTVLLFGYDSTKSIRTCPDFGEAFARAEQYVTEGTPIRRTNRAGCGTIGTRLVKGIGCYRVEFAVR